MGIVTNGRTEYITINEPDVPTTLRVLAKYMVEKEYRSISAIYFSQQQGRIVTTVLVSDKKGK